MLFYKNKELNFYPNHREKVKWKVPGLFENDKIILLLHDLCKELNIRQPIQIVFGGILSPWQGGRIPQIDIIKEKELYELINKYNERGIRCNITFSNYRITKSDLDDYMGNLVCKVINDINSSNEKKIQNGIIISSKLLSDYIREKYPYIEQTSSVIKPYYEYPKYDETPEYYNDLCNKFDRVCIRPENNTNKNFLKKLKYKNKIELMVNQLCFYKCPLSIMHYDNSVKYSKDDVDAEKRIGFCQKKVRDIKTIKEHLINNNEQIDKMISLGFYNLKLQGRGASAQTLLMGIIGRYIFYPTGYFQIIENHILHELGYR